MSINLGDITKINARELEHCDIIISTSPCQSFSNAGNRDGFDGESGLMFETLRTVKEMQPKVVIWENVGGALSKEKTTGLPAIKSLTDCLIDLGYNIDCQYHNALDYGVPQSRGRISVCAIKKELWSSNKQEEHRHPKIRKALGKDYPLISGIATFKHEPIKSSLWDIVDEEVNSKYIVSDKASIGVLRRVWKANKKLPKPIILALINQSGELWNEDYFCGAKEKFEAEPIRKYWLDMIASDDTEIADSVFVENHLKDHRIRIVENSQTLSSSMGTGGGNVPFILSYQNRLSADNVMTDKTTSLCATDYKGAVMVCEPIYSVTTGNIKPKSFENFTQTIKAGNSKLALCYNYILRYITEKEGLKLQGMPSDWLDVPEISKTAKYRMIGNAIALPYWEILLRNIKEFLTESTSITEPTIFSQFSGYGSFELIAKRVGCKVLYTSEIDKDCNKVTEFWKEKGRID